MTTTKNQKLKIPLFALSAYITLGFYAHPAQAFFSDDEARRAIIDVRQTISQQQQRLQNIELNVQNMQRDVDGLKQQQQQLRALIEQTQFSHTQQEQEANKIYQQLKQQIQTQEEKLQTLQKPVSTPAVLPNGFFTPPEAVNRFQTALDAMRKSQFKQASQLFQQLIIEDPQNPDIDQAYYYLGNSYYAQRDYKRANEALLQFTQRYPTHDKMPEVYLTLAAVAQESGNKNAAKLYLQHVVKNYVGHESAVVAKERLQTLR